MAVKLKFLEEKLGKEKAYWTQKLGGELVLTRLTADFRKAEEEQQRVSLEFGESLLGQVRRVCGQSEPLIFTALVSALKICLYEYTGVEDVIVGTSIHRKYAGTAALNRVLVLRDQINSRETGRQVLERVKQTLAEAYEHQKYPYEKILEWLRQRRLFSVGIVFESLGNKEYLEELRDDLDVSFVLRNGQLDGEILYNAGLFKRETVELFGRHYLKLLETLLEQPDVEIGQYELLSAEERDYYLYEFNRTKLAYAGPQTVSQLFEAQVRETPMQWAASFGEQRLTYEELNERANQLAHYLHAQGVGAGTLVGICLDHSLELLVALLGTLKAGAGYVPIDPEHPQARRERMIEDAGLQLVLTPEYLDRNRPLIAKESIENPEWPWQADDLAYVIYTSGSSGTPKGIKIAQSALVNYLNWAKDVYLQDEQLDFPLYSSLAFDLTVTSIYVPLLSGNRVVVYRKDMWESPLLKILQEDQVGVVKLTPSHLMLIKERDNRQSHIKRLIVGGEALTTRLAREVYQSFGGNVEIYNEYGPTEATVGCMIYRYQPETDDRAFVPIGRPAANTQIYVLDEAGRPVAPNLKGELCIGGAGLAQGYLNQPELTAAKFVEHPFVPGAKLYRSGDLARFLPEGEIEYLGRQDEQVKFHGHRLELNGIRSVINQHPEIKDSVVLLTQDDCSNDWMLAYYVAQQELDSGELRSFLAQHLIEETLPNLFVHLEQMPLTLNGKINQHALPSLSEARSKLQLGFEVPRTPLEEIVAGIWGRFLGLDHIGLDDNFFRLGGHSLLATRVMAHLQEAFQVQLVLARLFETPTVRGLVAYLEEVLSSGVSAELPPIRRVARKNAMPLSFAQQRLWFLHQLVSDSPLYNVPAAVRLTGRLDQQALACTFTEIVRRHEVLRTAFARFNGEPAQQIRPAEPIKVPLVDLRDLPSTTREAEAVRLAIAEAQRPFDLSQSPLLRALQLQLGDDEQIICLTMHHIVSDGWSMGVLVREVMALYEAYAQGNSSPLPELPIQYADFAAWQRGWLQGNVLEEQLNYWRKQLDGAPTVLKLPTRTRPAVQTHQGARQRLLLDADLLAQLKELSHRENSTLFMVLLATFQVLLCRYSGQEDILVGSPVANRNRAETENLIGFFVNTLVLRAKLQGNPTFREFLRQARETTLGAFAHQDLPFERLVDELQSERDASRQPLFQVMFALQNLPRESLELDGLKLSHVELAEVTAKFDLMVVMGEAEAGLFGALEYNSDLFNDVTIRDMCRHFHRLLESVVTNPEGRIQELKMLSDEEHRLLEQPITVDEFQGSFDFNAPAAERSASGDSDDAALNFKFLEEKLEKEKTYWTQKLGGELVLTRLTADFRKAEEEQQRVSLEFGESLLGQLRRVCGQSEPLIFTALVSALKICLHEYTGVEDVIVGTSIHRKYAGTAALNRVLALRDQINSRETGRQVLERVKQTLAEAYEHQKYPYEKILEWLRQRGLFSVSVVLESIGNKQYLDELHNDLDVSFVLRNGRLEGEIVYNAGLFKRETVELFGRHYLKLLETLLEQPDVEIGQYELLTAAERDHYLYEFNQTKLAYAGAQTVSQLFEAQVRETPMQWAASFGEQRLTYEELNERANQLAHYLRAQGVGTGTLVGIYLDHSLELLVALLGTLKAGAGYVPIDPEHPQARRERMIEDAGLQLVLTPEYLDRELPLIAKESIENPNWPRQADDLAYVIYTSGSSGSPKGIKITQSALVNYLNWAKDVYLQGEQLDFPLYSSLAFDLTVTSIYVPLLSGNRVVVYRKDMWESPLLKILQEDQVGVVKLTPSHLMLIKERDNRQSHIKRLIVGGEALTTRLAREVYQSFGGNVEIYNEYGPTEATVGCMIYRYQPDIDERAFVPIGRPAANTQIYVLDEAGRPVAPNLKGELCIGGAGLAQGYLNQPELTAAKFVEHPFVPGAKLYRSGDLARFLPEGEIEYLGRQDEQVKFHGHRVELNEIRSIINQHPQIRDSVVLLTQDSWGNDVMLAYYVARQELDGGELRTFLAQHVIEETLPNLFVHISRMPLTLNGKINYQALPSLSEARDRLQQEYAAPQTPLEEIVAGVWAEVLGLKHVGVDDNFFRLGGHSLLATRVISHLQEAFQVELMLRTLFEKPTVRGLAASLQEALHHGAGLDAPPIVRVPRKTAMPLSFAQQRLWFLDRLNPNSTVYSMPISVHLAGTLNAKALEDSLNEILKRHEALRNRFVEVDGSPAVTTAPSVKINLPVYNLTQLPDKKKAHAILRYIKTEADRPFDLSRGPLLRASLLKLSDNEHIALLSMHHIVCDGWSMGVLVREVATLYEAFVEGKSSPLPELPIQYVDFAVWQREWLQGPVLEKQLNYWRQQLWGAPGTLNIPTDFARPSESSFRGAHHPLRIPTTLLTELKELGQREGTTLFMTLLAAWQTLLSRYSRQEDIVIGTPIANRNRAETEGLIGFFVNLLVLRTDLSGNPTFRELLGRVREVALEAYAHQDLPFEKLVEELQPERRWSHMPMFHVAFVMQNAAERVMEIAGLQLTPVGAESEATKCDLVMTWTESDGQLLGEISYSTELFAKERIVQMSKHFLDLLESVVKDPEQALQDVNFMSDAELRLLEERSEPESTQDEYQCIHKLFEEQVALRGDTAALVYQGEQISYRELDQRAQRLARYLRALGVGTETIVALLLPRNVEMVVAVLAVLKAGGGYLCLDAEYPPQRLSFMLADVGAKVVLTEQSLVERLPLGIGARIVSLDRERHRIADQSTDPIAVNVNAENLAYVTYTSGSTGEPKGTEVPHRSITGFMRGVSYATFDEHQVFLQHSSTSWDALTLELWAPLLQGGRCVLYEGRVLTPGDLQRMVQEHGVNTIWLTSSLFNNLVDTMPEALGGLKQLLIGGESISVPHVRKAMTHWPELRIINGYGPSECTVFSSCFVINELPGEQQRSIPIGRPIGDRRVYLLDPRLRRAAIGTSGEIYIGGPSVSRDYLKRPALTAERFVPDPFSIDGGERLYRTGDLARYLADGNLEFLGRVDQQVKVRGFRIELDEIREMLNRHPAVTGSVVMAREDEPGDKRLVAYVVAADGLELKPSELREYLREQMPEYMVPSAIVMLPQLPLTAHGKLDYQALPSPDELPRSLEDNYVAPRTAVEEVVAGVWAEVLGVERVGLRDNFFELGGHSLLATQITSRVREIFKIDLPLRQLFEQPTVEELARGIEAERGSARFEEVSPLQKVTRDGRLPLSFAQQRLWFINQMEPESVAYNVPISVRLHGPLNVDVMERTLSEIVRRHESLRTGFAVRDGEIEPVQVIQDARPVKLPLVDLCGVSAAVQEAEVERLVQNEGVRTFSLNEEPPLRWGLVKLSEMDHVVLFTMHHIVSDGWSMGVFMSEVGALYDAYSQGKPSPLPELTLQYADFAMWQREWMKGAVLDEQLAFWRRQLSGAPSALELPSDYVRPQDPSFSGAHQPLRVAPELLRKLKDFNRREGTTLFMTLLAAWQALLSRYSSQEDIVVGTPIANRNRAETENLIGFFVNLLVMRSDMSGNPTFRELLGRVREVALGAYAHQDLPFEKLVEELQPERRWSHMPMFQIAFVMQNASEVVTQIGDLQLTPAGIETGITKCDLIMIWTENNGELLGQINYTTELFARERMSQMARHYLNLLESVVNDPEQRLQDVVFISDEELRLLEQWAAA